MFMKKHFKQTSINGVSIGQGKLSFRGVKFTIHSFSVDGVIIDTGSRSLENMFQTFFNEQKVDKVVLTHYHEDHSGGAAYLSTKLNLPIYMNEIMMDYCKHKADYPLYRKLFWGSRKPFESLPIGQFFSSRNATWNVIETPGHSKDHLAFLNRETGQLFTGDLYCQDKTKIVLREEHVPSIIHSLERVLTYDFEDVFCCHAGYIKNGRTALNRKLSNLLELQEQIIHYSKEGKPAEEISSILFPKKYPLVFFSSGEWSSLNLVQSILSEYQNDIRIVN